MIRSERKKVRRRTKEFLAPEQMSDAGYWDSGHKISSSRKVDWINKESDQLESLFIGEEMSMMADGSDGCFFRVR